MRLYLLIFLLGFHLVPEISCQELINNSNNDNSDASNIINIGGFRYGTYKVSSLDKILVSVFGEPELEVSEIVDRNGSVYLRLIGEIKSPWLTCLDLAEMEQIHD